MHRFQSASGTGSSQMIGKPVGVGADSVDHSTAPCKCWRMHECMPARRHAVLRMRKPAVYMSMCVSVGHHAYMLTCRPVQYDGTYLRACVCRCTGARVRRYIGACMNNARMYVQGMSCRYTPQNQGHNRAQIFNSQHA